MKNLDHRIFHVVLVPMIALLFSWGVAIPVFGSESVQALLNQENENQVSRSAIHVAELDVVETNQGDSKPRPENEESPLWQEIKDGFSYTFRTLGYGTINDPSDSSQNPNNDFLNIPRYTLNLDLRPDVSFNFRRLTLVAKPRLDLSWKRWETSLQNDNTDTDDDWYINEWLVGLNPFNGLFASYGREILLWGPSRMVSPSNPFFPYNGQTNPKIQLPGMDFARLIWVASGSWTASFIANLGAGRMDFPYGFESTYAFKIDYTGKKKYASLIGSYREDDRGRLGAYGGWWATDALLFYAEGSISRGTEALYPQIDPTDPFGIEMLSVKDDDSSLEGLLTAGCSYTMESGATFTLEYFFNSPGYNDDEAELYETLRTRAADAFYSPEPLQNLSQMTLKQTLYPNLRFLRRNYITFQYYQVEIRDVLDLMLRYTYNIDDSSSMLIPVVQYDIGNNLQVFLVGNQHFGSKNSEFRSLIDYSYMIGLEFTF